MRIDYQNTPLRTGENIQLICTIIGADNLQPITTYQWNKNNGSWMTIGSNSTSLDFSPLRLSDAANYSCEVIITSPHLNQTLQIRSTPPFTVQLQGEHILGYT